MKISLQNNFIYDKLHTKWVHSNYLQFDVMIKELYDIKISNSSGIWSWRDEYLEFETQEDYFLFLLKLS